MIEEEKKSKIPRSNINITPALSNEGNNIVLIKYSIRIISSIKERIQTNKQTKNWYQNRIHFFFLSHIIRLILGKLFNPLSSRVHYYKMRITMPIGQNCDQESK